jgi:ABC-type nitrate/sulfonate/bicarbonate transport system permease component
MGSRLGALLSIGSVIVFLLVWQVASTWFIDPFFLPPPSAVASGGWELITTHTIFTAIGVSLGRILAGWLLGSIIAIPIGLIVGSFAPARSIVDPFVHFFRFVPAIALVTLFIVWFGVGEVSKILLIAYATAFIVVVNTASGVSSIPAEKLDAARCLGASRRQVFLHVVIPASLPSIYVAMRLALASSFLVIVAAEMLAADSGLGYLIWTSRLYFRIDWMFAALVTLGVLGFTCDWLWKLLGRTTLERYLRNALRY